MKPYGFERPVANFILRKVEEHVGKADNLKKMVHISIPLLWTEPSLCEASDGLEKYQHTKKTILI